MNRNPSIIAACLCCCLIALPARGEDDQLYMKRGPTVSGTVSATTPVQVAIESRGANRSVNVNEIRLITFGDEPQELRQGRARALGGKYEAALGDLKRVNPAGIERGVIQQDLQYYLALCEGRVALSSGGDKAKAVATMLGFVRAAPSSYHFFDAAMLLGDLSVGQADYDGAVKYYGAVASKAPWPEYRMNAALSQARVLVAQEKFAAAQAQFDSVIQMESDTPEANRQKLLAQVGKGRCLAETKSPEAGIQLIEKIIAENEATDAELFGRAYNAHGDCLQKAGKPKAALMSYLHVDVLFYSNPEIHAESLYHLSKLWETIKQPDRAASTRNLLDQRYAGSAWAKRQ